MASQMPTSEETPSASPPEEVTVERGPDQALVRLLCVGAGLLGLLAMAIAFHSDPHPWVRPWLFGTFTLGLSALYVMPLQLSHEGQGENIHLEEAFLVPMALTLSLPEVLLGLGLAVTLGNAYRRRGWLKATFNAGQMMACAGVGLTLARQLGSHRGDYSTHSLVATVAGVLFVALLSMLAVTTVITIVQANKFVAVMFDGLLVRVATWTSSLALGVLIATAMRVHLWTLPVTVLPIATLQLIYSRSFGQYQERRRIELLYDAAASIRSSMDTDKVLRRLLESSRSLLNASEARLVDKSTPIPANALRAEIDPDRFIEVDTPIGGGEWAENDASLLRALASVASNAVANATLFEQMRTVTASLGEGVIALDRSGRVEFANPAAEELLGWSETEILGWRLHDLVHSHHHGNDPDCALIAATLTGVTARDDDSAFSRKDGRLLPVAHTISPVVRDGDIVGSVIAFRDITERKMYEQELSHQAFHDTLTGLPNRALFLDRLGQAHARAGRSGAVYALLFIDLDRFKVVNDSLGHQAGDQLLIDVADRLKGCVRPGDTFARFGGDEFVALLEDLASEEDATAVAERVLDELQAPFSIWGRDMSMSASIGVVIGSTHHASPDHCLRDADVAMYRAKARGKACYELFRADMEGSALERLDMEIALRSAIDRDELELFYQPIVSLESVSVVGVEALVRWRHPQRGLLSPAEFIPLAEETGLILPLGRWVLEEACRQIHDWQDRFPGTAPLIVTVNLSARQFAQPDLVDQVSEAIAKTDINPRQLTLEVTESVMMDDVESATQMAVRLKALGAGLAIDDFGTGYSSLSYLKRFPVDYVKIDRSFIADLGTGKVDSEIVRAVVRLASAIGMRTVAEGVETEDQLRELRSMGCPLVQGYYLARPQPARSIETLLADRIPDTITLG